MIGCKQESSSDEKYSVCTLVIVCPVVGGEEADNEAYKRLGCSFYL